MAEVAAAASAAGLASLGIQCCKGLTTYYNSYKSYDEQTGATLEQIQVLTVLLEELEKLLSRSNANPAQISTLQLVDSILNLCQGRLQKLESVLQKCQSITLPNTKMATLRKIKSQALFPFREQTLLTLRENVQSLGGDLRSALSVLQTVDSGLAMDLSRNVELVSQKTHSDIQAIATPVYHLLQQGQDTQTRLSEMQAQKQQNHEVVLNLCRDIPEQCRLLLQQDWTSSRSLEQELIEALRLFGTEWELRRSAIESFGRKREGEAEELAMGMGVLVRSL
ncbi:MAG: hypothetical protein Q9208_002500 [Pyrenodesmia sp. 3 TL-2023]